MIENRTLETNIEKQEQIVEEENEIKDRELFKTQSTLYSVKISHDDHKGS